MSEFYTLLTYKLDPMLGPQPKAFARMMRSGYTWALEDWTAEPTLIHARLLLRAVARYKRVNPDLIEIDLDYASIREALSLVEALDPLYASLQEDVEEVLTTWQHLTEKLSYPSEAATDCACSVWDMLIGLLDEYAMRFPRVERCFPNIRELDLPVNLLDMLEPILEGSASLWGASDLFRAESGALNPALLDDPHVELQITLMITVMGMWKKWDDAEVWAAKQVLDAARRMREERAKNGKEN